MHRCVDLVRDCDRHRRITLRLAQHDSIGKLYVEFERAQTSVYIRVLQAFCLKNGLALNGGNPPRAFRSFGDSGRQKRVRLFLAKRPGNLTPNQDILDKTKDCLKENLLKALVGWESTYEIPEESYILLGTDLHLPLRLAHQRPPGPGCDSEPQ